MVLLIPKGGYKTAWDNHRDVVWIYFWHSFSFIESLLMMDLLPFFFHSPTNFHFYCPLAIIIHPLQIRVLSVHFNFHCISVSFNIGTLVVQGSSVPVIRCFIMCNGANTFIWFLIWLGIQQINISVPLLQVFFEELTFNWALMELVM